MIEQLKDATKDILSEDSLGDIEKAFNEAVTEKVQLHVEKALMEQDTAHTTKLQKLLDAVDNDHTAKLEALVEAIDKDHMGKLNAVIRRHQGILGEQANGFKQELVESISNYMELYLDKVAPQDMLKQAVTNKRAVDFLAELRNLLAVNGALEKASIKNAVMDGKLRLDEATEKISSLETQNVELRAHAHHASAQMVLENKCLNLPDQKKSYVQNLLKDKDVQFINENFDYTVEMFDMTEEQRLEEMKSDAIQDIKSRDVDRPILEQVEQSPSSPAGPAYNEEDYPHRTAYMKELGKY